MSTVFYKAWYDGPRGTAYKHHATLEQAEAEHPKYKVLPVRIDKVEIIRQYPERMMN